MSYFQHTKTDLLNAKREVAEMFAALLDDTARKINSDDELDRTYLLEDLLSRGAELAENYASETRETFPALTDTRRATPAYPLLDAETEEPKAAPVLDLSQAIREAWQLETFDGVRRHTFEGSYSGMVCGRMVLRRGHGEDCGLPATHVVHETNFENRNRNND